MEELGRTLHSPPGSPTSKPDSELSNLEILSARCGPDGSHSQFPAIFPGGSTFEPTKFAPGGTTFAPGGATFERRLSGGERGIPFWSFLSEMPLAATEEGREDLSPIRSFDEHPRAASDQPQVHPPRTLGIGLQ